MDNPIQSVVVMSNEDSIHHYFVDKEEGHGWFAIPRGLIAMVQAGYISKSEFTFLCVLMHLENKFNAQGNWFFHSDKDVCSTGLLSYKSLSMFRKELKKKGLIDFKQGRSHRATEYLILIPKQYYVKQEGSLEIIDE